MTTECRDQIITERFKSYRQRLAQHGATPLTCIGIVDVGGAPKLVVCITEDLALRDLRKILLCALSEIDAAIEGGKR